MYLATAGFNSATDKKTRPQTFAQKYQPPHNAWDQKSDSLNIACYTNTAETEKIKA